MARKATSRSVLHKRIFEHISANRWIWFAGLTVVILSAATSYFAVELRSIEAFTGPTGGGGSGTGAIVTDAEGDIGIGTSTTPYKLNVQGQINSSGGLCIAGDCKSAWSQVTPPQQWLTSGSNLYYTAGSVGIGNTPNTPLDVTGTATVRGDLIGNNNAALNLYQNTGASNGSFLELNTANAILGAGNTGSIILRDYNGSSWDDNLTILSGGNVGIGHTSPDGKLAIIKNTAATTWNENENDWGIKLADGTADTAILLGVSSGQNTGAIQVMDPSTAWSGRNLLLQPAGGNVGIATTSPAYALSVQGQTNASGGLCIAGDCKTAWSQVGGSQWTSGTGLIYYNGGPVGVGTAAPAGTESYSRFTVEGSDATAFQNALINTGTGQVGWAVRRTGGTAARWYGYIPGGSTDFRLYNGSDQLVLNNAGTLTVTGNLSATGGSLTLAGVNRMTGNGTYTQLYDGVADTAIYLGGTGDPGNYYDNTTHTFRANDHGTNFLVINSGATNIVSGPLQIDGNTVIDDGAGWHRSYNNTGWYNQTYCGGWYMQDTTWIRSYCSKSVYIDAAIRADGGIVSGPYGSQGGSTIYAGGNVWAGAYYYTSDIRLKKDVRPIENALDLVSQLQGRRFVWKDSNKPSLGLIAQEVEQVIPEAVYYDEKNDRKFIDSGILIGPMVESIKELKARIETQENKIGELQKEIEALRQK